MAFVVGLTGGIGSGKSLAAQFFSQLGALVIDADQLARSVIERGSEGFDEVLLRFGDTVLKNGDIDRVALGQIVFENPEAKKDLEEIIHPRIRAEFEEAVASLNPGQIMVYEIPLLVETNAADRFDFVITVESDAELRKQRLRARGMFHSDIEKRMASQATEEQRRAIADCVLTNDGSEDELLRQVENVWESTILPRAQN
uniref:dephospho-CoA kinase n=1 Tax=Candidatus Planktophila sp. TaxID=2175601 RepID=UPI00404B6B61